MIDTKKLMITIEVKPRWRLHITQAANTILGCISPKLARKHLKSFEANFDKRFDKYISMKQKL